MRKMLLVGPSMLAAAGALAGWMYAEARSDPVVRSGSITLPGLPSGTAMRLVLLGDIHIGSAAMDEHRLTRIVDQVNALRPDLVLIAGDLIFGHAPNSAATVGEAAVAPLSRLRPRLGSLAVLGNHDHWTGAAAVRGQLSRAGITLLDNSAVTIGPIAVGGIGDDFTRRADLPRTLAQARSLRRPILLFSHSPDVAADLPPDAPLLLAGHTHCGQGVIFGRQLAPSVSRYGSRYRCGLIREGARTVLVTAGLGTSAVPLRLGAPPDLWLLTLGAAQR